MSGDVISHQSVRQAVRRSASNLPLLVSPEWVEERKRRWV